MRFELFTSKDGQFYFNIVSDNNKIVATSETYTQKSSMLKTIMSILQFFVIELDKYTLDNMEVAELIKDRTKEWVEK